MNKLIFFMQKMLNRSGPKQNLTSDSLNPLKKFRFPNYKF